MPGIELHLTDTGYEDVIKVPPASRHEITIADFVERVFVPEHVAHKKVAGRIHYQAALKHILTPEKVDAIFLTESGKSDTRLKAVSGWPYLGHLRLIDTRPGDVQRLVEAALAHGYSTQTVTHLRNVVGAIFSHAIKKQWFYGPNPARGAVLPRMCRKEAFALTIAQTQELLSALRHPEKEMAMLALLTDMNMAEICGLQWKFVNLAEKDIEIGGETIPARTIAVRQQWYRGQLSGVNLGSRSRNLPIPESLYPVLSGLRRRMQFAGADDFVLASRSGRPVDERKIAVRRLQPIGQEFQMPWLCWRVLRRTRVRLVAQFGLHFPDVIMRPAKTDCAVRLASTAIPGAGDWTGAYWVQLAPPLEASLTGRIGAAGIWPAQG
jgi:site-specific recombinase XerC